MEDYKYLGSIFHHEENGMEFKISFDCKEEQDPETGLMIIKVDNIEVYQNQKESSNMVDMEKLAFLCEEKAINKILNHVPPNDDELRDEE